MAKSGFSLVELIMAMAVLVLLCGIFTTGMLDYLPGYRLDNAGRELLQSFRRARFEAVKRNARVVLDFNQTGNNYRMFIDRDENFSLDSTDMLLGSTDLHNAVDISEAVFSFGYTESGFDPRGLPASNRIGHVALQADSGEELEVVLSMAGKVNIDK